MCVRGVIWIIFYLKPILLVGFFSPGLTTSCKSISFTHFPLLSLQQGSFPEDPSPRWAGLVLPIVFPGMSVPGSDGERTDRQKGGTEWMQTPLLESEAKRKGCVKERNNSYKRNLLGSYRPCSSQSPSEIAV